MNLKGTTPLPPLPNESEYFYDDYVDYPYENGSTTVPEKSHLSLTTASSIEEFSSLQVSSEPSPPATGGTPTIYAASGSGATNRKNKTTMVPTKDVPPSPSSSGFTFFGVPLPSLNFNLWGNSGRKADRKSDSSGRPGRGRVHLFPPTEPEIHRGGFVPIPRGESGFVPIVDPQIRYQMEMNRSLTYSNKNRTIQQINKKGEIHISQKQTSVYSTSQGPKNVTEKTVNRSGSEPKVIKPKLSLSVKERSNVTTQSPASMTSKDFKKPPISVTQELSNATQTPDKITEKIEVDQTSVSSEIHEADSQGAHGEVASRIVWTTPRAASTTNPAEIVTEETDTVTTTIPPNVTSIKSKSTFWNFGDWLKPKTRTNSSSTTTNMPEDVATTGND